MSRGKIGIIGNARYGLGAYLYRRSAQPFAPDFDCVHLNFEQGIPRDCGPWLDDNGIVAVVIGGSLLSPLSDREWIRDEEELVRGLVERGVPTLGICFGHEIMASALGGELGRWKTMRLELDRIVPIVDDPIFAGFDGEILSPVSHSVYVSKLPPDFVHIARSEKCEYMGMRHREHPVYGVQFHPEMDPEIKEHDPIWNPMKVEDLASNQGGRIFENFKRIVMQSAGVSSAKI